MNKKFTIRVASVFCLLITAGLLISGCSYRQMEDSVKQNIAESDQDEMAEMEDRVPSYDLSEDKEYAIGDEVTVRNGTGSVVYTVTGIRTGSTLSEFGVDRGECSSMEREYFIGKNGEPLGGPFAAEGETYTFLQAEIRIQNVDNTGEGVPGEPVKLYLDVDVRTESEIETDNVHNQGMVYFSAHADDEQGYLSFLLEPGDETTVKVLWSVRESDFDEPFYCVAGMSLGREERQMILLNP